MKFLHCADLHLDSPLRGLARRDGAPVGVLRGATRVALEQLVEVAEDEQVGAVVIAGDLYDANRDDYQTAVFLQRQLHRLRDSGIRVVLAYGNHDAASEITRRLSLPENTSVLPATDPGSVVLDDLGLACHGQSYPTRVVDQDLSAGYPAPIPGLVNVGVLHTSLDGRPGHDRYAPCTVEGLVRRGYAYWALGHVHQREAHVRDTVHIVFPGNLCGRDVGETGAKGATVVEHDGETVTSTTAVELAPVRWHRLRVDAPDAVSVAEITEAVLGRLDGVRRSSPAALHAVRVTVDAGPRARGEWARHAEQCEVQLRADAAGGDGAVWIEQIALHPASDAAVAVSDEAMAAVAGTVASWRSAAAGDGRLVELLGALRSRFGAERDEAVRLGALGLDDASLPSLVDEAEALLAAELRGGG